MLRRKLLIRIGLLIGGFVAGAVVAIWFLQGVLGRIDQVNRDAHTLMDNLQEVGSSRVDLQACKLEYSIVSPK